MEMTNFRTSACKTAVDEMYLPSDPIPLTNVYLNEMRKSNYVHTCMHTVHTNCMNTELWSHMYIIKTRKNHISHTLKNRNVSENTQMIRNLVEIKTDSNIAYNIKMLTSYLIRIAKPLFWNIKATRATHFNQSFSLFPLSMEEVDDDTVVSQIIAIIQIEIYFYSYHYNTWIRCIWIRFLFHAILGWNKIYKYNE